MPASRPSSGSPTVRLLLPLLTAIWIRCTYHSSISCWQWLSWIVQSPVVYQESYSKTYWKVLQRKRRVNSVVQTNGRVVEGVEGDGPSQATPAVARTCLLSDSWNRYMYRLIDCSQFGRLIKTALISHLDIIYVSCLIPHSSSGWVCPTTP